MRILLVEDDPLLCRDVSTYLLAEGHQIEVMTRGDWAASFAVDNAEHLDLAILDLGLPQLSGMEVLRYWRRHQVLMPVLILTARNSWQERVEGLNAGADDYLGKPFQREELLARLEALRRRVQQQGLPDLLVGPLRLDDGRQSVWCEDREENLTATEFGMLRLLMQNPGKIISKQQLLDVSGDWQEEKNENLAEVYIRRLRLKVGTDRIRTFRGQGYRLDAS
jgi:two-component system, OmpR family, response regulator